MADIEAEPQVVTAFGPRERIGILKSARLGGRRQAVGVEGGELVEVKLGDAVEEEILQSLQSAGGGKTGAVEGVRGTGCVPCKAEAELVQQVRGEVVICRESQDA